MALDLRCIGPIVAASSLALGACGDRTALTQAAVEDGSSPDAPYVPFQVGSYRACQATEWRQGAHEGPTTGFVLGDDITVSESHGILTATFSGPLASGSIRLDATTDHTARVIADQVYTLSTRAYTAPWACTRSGAVAMTVTSGSLMIQRRAFGCNMPQLTLTLDGQLPCGAASVVFVCCDSG